MSLAFLVFLRTRNPAVVDFFWGLGLMGLALLFFGYSPQAWPHYLLLATVCIWALRLSLFILGTRIIPQAKDRRYEALFQSQGGYALQKTLGHYYFQALLQLGLCAVFAIGFSRLSFSTPFFAIGISLSILSIVGEHLADIQLLTHKRTGKGLFTQKLFSLSRHPNYMFDVLFWLGLAIAVQQGTSGLQAFASPLVIWIIFKYFSGPYTEKLSLEKYGKTYRHYQATTGMIFPKMSGIFGFKRRNNQ